ncbi:hypothetical protein MTBBW1_830053 [Desulfamplus magnetovallimortis]|uniref:Uncharacterized protein n=1 Tax=Desulfamplus magnetovallimortis TaxID=1246637 RepID=A0A1W1HKG2_9BACT|nr:hypothetical protein [Desulfamplus magnetovallimortis]SLM32981.1 hypothetical protein MTBBW1_830053 [Desulfamplus magnetovallimortis]
MSGRKFTYIIITGSSGDNHKFDNIKDLKVNVENGLLDLHLDDGSFVFMFDGLRYFEVGLPVQQGVDVRFQSCEVRLTSVGKGVEETISISEVINCEWKADQGLFMVFCKSRTFAFHLDHVISYFLKNQV